MGSLFKYLFHRPTWHKLPPVPRMYSTEFLPSQVDQDTQTIMRMTHVRCPQGVEVLKQRYRVKSNRELIAKLPRKRRPRRVLKRLMNIFRTAFGLLDYDPMKSIYRQHLRQTRRR